MTQVQEDAILARITINRRLRRQANHPRAPPGVDDLLREYPWMQRDDVQACLVYAKRLVAHERVEPAVESPGA